MEKILEENRNGLERLKDRERTMEADRKYMAGFELNFQQHYAKRAGSMKMWLKSSAGSPAIQFQKG